MGYFINPVNFDDQENVNKIPNLELANGSIIEGKEKIVKLICSQYKNGLLIADGYMTADIESFARLIYDFASADRIIDIKSLFTSKQEIDALIADCLPEDRETDPRLIYGKLYPGEIEDFLDQTKVNEFLKSVSSDQKTILFGNGSLINKFADIAKAKVFIDMTPKDTGLRINHGKYCNIGNEEECDFDAMTRRAYFVDVELITKIRRHAIRSKLIDYYILENYKEHFTYINSSAFQRILERASEQPIRPKPFYIEGVWGGQFIKKLRHIPDDVVEKVSWSFEFIPTEASVAFEIDSHYLDVPFLTIMDAVGERLIGEKMYSRFNGYFPIRFNYDDTWHSDGNMSIQCHPNDEMAKGIHGDYGGQSEAYYIVMTGHDARTYLGFKAGTASREFFHLCRQSEVTGDLVPYQDYINGLESKPGIQVFIPAGTVHGSGRNQVVLELGTFTINAYTYKIYDYGRKGLDGRPRPIHSKLAEEALVFDRDENWVKENVAIDPVLYDEQQDFKEYIVGRHDLMYFETHKVNLNTGGTYHGKNDKGFCVLTIVDGERAEIRAEKKHEEKYLAKYLDVVLVPATVQEYEVENRGKQPVVFHKAFVREE